MTLQQPIASGFNPKPILCHKCGAQIVFSKDHISPITKSKVPLDPYFNNQPHAQHCMYFTAPTKTDTEVMLFDFLSMVPKRNHTRQRRIIGAAGKART